MANAVQKGFERISGGCVNWWWNYGRTSNAGFNDRSPGVSTFGGAKVFTQFIHHPFRYGLLNVIHPTWVLKTAGVHIGPGRHRASDYEKLMCDFDVVVFESGVHDIALPDGHKVLIGLKEACSRRTPCSDADILPVLLRNESYRLDMLSAYRSHLHELMAMWTRCHTDRERRRRGAPVLPPFRPIFKLAYAPGDTPGNRRAVSPCSSPWGYNAHASYMQVANEVARQVVEANGFEVFDPFPAGMHSVRSWYDGSGSDVQHSDVLSDLVTQMLLNQICHA